MKKLTKGSTWVSLLEQLIYISPTLGTVLYYYFSSIRENISKSSQYTFALALVLLVLFIIYKKITKRNIEELRQATVQQETDMRSEINDEKLKRLADNSKSDRMKLDLYNRGGIILTLLIVALSVRILEMSLIGLTNLAYIACGSVLAGSGVHIGVLALKKREGIKEYEKWRKKQENKK